jgi:RimJ/RimL family protein N-acetyltransferase
MVDSTLFFGPRIRLTALRPEDVHAWVRWYEDAEFGRMFDANIAYPRSQSRVRNYLDDVDRHKDNSFAFAIRPLYSEDILGYAELDGILWNNRSAWLAIAIGDPNHRGMGYGHEAMLLLLRFAFHELNLHRVQLTVFEYNARAIALYERLGFQREGIYREALLRDGRRYDIYLYAILSHEWAELHRGGTG